MIRTELRCQRCRHAIRSAGTEWTVAKIIRYHSNPNIGSTTVSILADATIFPRRRARSRI